MVKFLDIQQITESYQPELSAAVENVIRRGWFLLGEELSSFEKEYSQYIGTGYCIGVANGLDALRLIFRSYIELGRLKEGDEVIVPANTYIASILAITENRLKPVFVEPDPATYNLDINRIEGSITDKTRAILVVHLYGRLCWSEELEEIAKKKKLLVVEDNAQAAGAIYFGPSNKSSGKRSGALGDAAGHSFYPGKNFAAIGDAGSVTTDDEDLAKVLRTIANYGSSRKYINDFKGLNSRLDEIQAAVLRIKLKRLDDDNRHRRIIAKKYLESIKSKEIILPSADSTDVLSDYGHVWHLFVIWLKRRDELVDFLAKKEIQTLIHYPIPPHRQKAMTEYSHMSLPITERIHSGVLSLPISQIFEEVDAEQVINVLNSF